MNIMKRTLLLSVLSVGLTSFAAQTFQSGELYYTVCGDGASVHVSRNPDTYGYNLSAAEIPAQVEFENRSFDVTGIEDEAFFLSVSLRTISIPETVVEIGKGAFKSCIALEAINLPAGIAVIESSTFAGCSALKQLVVPESVKRIGEEAFSMCSSLESVDFGASLEYIGREAFESCTSLMEVSIPDNVAFVGGRAFSMCDNLTSVIVGAGVEQIGYNAFGQSGLTSVRWNAVNCREIVYDNTSGSIYRTFPSSVSTLIIDENVSNIPDYLFCNLDKLSEVHLPDALVKIGSGAFAWCSSLSAINIPVKVETVGDLAFMGCDKLQTLYYDAIALTGGRGVGMSVPTPVEQIIFGDGVKSLPIQCFINYDKITRIELPETLETIGEEAFARCTGLTQIGFGTALQEIDARAFFGCSSLTGIDLGDTAVGVIKEGAFKNCALQSVIIGSYAQHIENEAFMGNPELKSVECKAENPPVCANWTFDNEYDSAELREYIDADLKVPSEAVGNYRAAAVWNWFKTINGDPYMSSLPDLMVPDAGYDGGVYNLQGVRVADSPVGLAPGLYIVNGRKIRV